MGGSNTYEGRTSSVWSYLPRTQSAATPFMCNWLMLFRHRGRVFRASYYFKSCGCNCIHIQPSNGTFKQSLRSIMTLVFMVCLLTRLLQLHQQTILTFFKAMLLCILAASIAAGMQQACNLCSLSLSGNTFMLVGNVFPDAEVATHDYVKP